MNPKILFTDLDATLLTDQKDIEPEVLDAIHAMSKKGHKFVLASGRPLASVLQLAEKYGFTQSGFYITSFNGALIYDCYEQKELRRIGIPHSRVRAVFDAAKERGIHVHTYTDTHVLTEKMSDMLLYYCEHIGLPYRIVDDVIKELDFEPQKIIVAALDDHALLETFREEMRPILEPALSSVFSNPRLLEYGNPDSTKGAALRFLCSYCNIPVENSVAAGDEENDIPMIEAAGIGVAMANAKESVKKAADFVTVNDNNHGGMKEIIERFLQ